jgi:hypothetical protein
MVASALLIVNCGGSREKAASERTKSAPVKITQFYSAKPQIHKGETALLCYGVENAKTLHLSPAVADLVPALTRCVEVKPTQTTSYTLTAEGADGSKTSNNVTIVVGGLPPDIYDFSVNTMTVKRGQQVSVCFKARNAASVSGGPGKFFLKGKPAGDCLMDAPKKTTRYEITVTGSSGETASRDVTVTVK